MLGKYFKLPADRKRYTIDYSDWLDAGEFVSTVTFQVIPLDSGPLVIDGIAVNPSPTGVAFFASAGLAGKTYKAIATMTTSAGQIREDVIQYTVKAP